MTVRRVELEPAYILHARAYRETSQLLEVFSHGHGRIGIVANGARRPKSAFRGYLNPFQSLRMSWSGRGELLRLSAVEAASPAASLPNAALMAGFYANELLLKLVERSDPHPDLFVHYAALIEGLASGQDAELLLRRFETELLSEMGYALDLTTDSTDLSAVRPGQFYELQIERGLVPVAGNSAQGLVYSGAQYLAIAQLELNDKETRRAAKRVLRNALDFYLGGRVLRTRQVAQAMRR